MSVELTTEQKDAIASRGRIIVSASAGSGKTFVMIERLVSLIVDEGVDVKNVLCVTFTNKAAAQMRDRLRTALVKRIPLAESESVRARLKAQLADLPLADICTIHSFCARMLRSRFYQAGVDPAFRIIASDDAVGKAISLRALDETFEQAYEEGGAQFESLLAAWFYKKRDKRLRGLVLNLYERARGSVNVVETLRAIGREDTFEKACRVVAESYKRRAEFYIESANAVLTFFADSNPRALKVAAEIIAASEPILNAERLFDMTALEKPAISNMPPTTKAEGEERRLLKRLAFSSKGVKALYSELSTFLSEAEEHALCDNARARAAALASLALVYDGAYDRIKKEKGVLDYDDLERYALALVSDEQTQKELREKYRYVFVDEYQDVNPVQEAILSAVSGDEVFLVGDGKQAIYGFRGSRSEYFNAKAEEFSALYLTRNFRSAQGVIEVVNRVFADVIEDYPLMTGGDRYGEHRGEAQFHFVHEKKKEESERGVYSVMNSLPAVETDALAEDVVSLVERERGTLFYDADAGRERSVEWGDIAVLVRKNTGDAERIVRALVARAIPVTTSSKVNVCDFFEARLIIDWLSLLDNAKQDIPLGTALLSGIGGFTDDELAAIRLDTNHPIAPYTFREACESYKEHKHDAIAQKLKAFFETYERLRALCRVRSAAEMTGVLLAEGLEMQIARKGNVRIRLSHVQRLVAEAGEDSVHEFLTRLKALGNRVDFCESGGENAVKVHTMHASKGLEYPVVILAGLDAPFHGTEKEELLFTDEFLAVPKSFDVEKKTVSENMLRLASLLVEERQRLGEEKNLLYVAMTRARYRLHMLFAGREQNPPAFAARFSDFVDIIDAAEYFKDIEELSPPKERRAMAGNGDILIEAQIRSVYRQPYAHEEATRLRVKSSATDLLNEADEQEDGRVRYNIATKGFTKEEGTAYHVFLQNVRFGQDAAAEKARMEKEGILTDEQARLVDTAQLEKILSIPCLRSLEDKRVWREQTFLMRLPAREMGLAACDDEVIFQGAIDLLVEDEDGYTVIDYKYSGREDSELAEHYAVQIKLYKKAVARLKHVREESVRARLVNIAKGREIELE